MTKAPPLRRHEVNYVEENLNEIEENVELSPKAEYLFYMEGEEHVIVSVGVVDLKMLIDIGARSNIISKKMWEILRIKGIKPDQMFTRSDKTFNAFGGMNIPVIGMFVVKVKSNDDATTASFYVVEIGEKALLGAETTKILKCFEMFCSSA